MYRFALLLLILSAAPAAAQFQPCPGGVCPAPGFAPTWVPPAAPVPRPMPPTQSPGPEWSWQYVPGYGWAWAKPVTPAAAKPAPAEAVGGPLSDLRDRVLTRIVRDRAADRLVKDGFRGKPVTYAEALKLLEKVDDPTILAAAKHYGAPGGRLENLLEWLANNRETILKLVEFVISLLGLLA